MRFRYIALLLIGLLGGAVAHAATVDLELKDVDGKIHRLSDYRGKWVVVNYWATWCPPCRSEIPELIFFHDAHKDKDAVVLGVNSEDAKPEKVRAFADDFMISYPIVLSDPDDGSPLGNIKGLPTTFIVSPRGEVVSAHLGMVSKKSLEESLAKLRAAQGKNL